MLAAGVRTVEERRPLYLLAKRPFLQNGRGEWRSFEPSARVIASITAVFGGAPEPFIIAVERLMQQSA